MATYRDMFELSRKPEDVITMDEAVKNRQDEIINNYVITSEIEGKFNDVLHQLSLETGKGYWVQGAYGCGKSHFMSFLTVLLSRSEAWERMPAEIRQEYRETFINNNYLTVNFTLSETSNLRMKFFDELETALHKEGIDILIKKDEKIVDQFLEYEYQMLQKELFYQRLEDYCEVKKEEWEKYLEENDVEKLAEIIVKYRQETGSFSQKEYREVIYPGTREGLEQVMPEIRSHFDGVVIFIDELSEFLLKKKASNEESETLEILQTLGQRIKEAPIWVFAAVQKNPAEIVDEEIYIGEEEEKVFDRFEPIHLSETNIEEIIDKRIIQKNDKQKKTIRTVYEELKETKPALEENVSPEKFVRFYPFHYDFISSLIYLSTFGSRQRAAVRECWKIVKKRMDTEAEDLITIDILYNVFKDDVIYRNFKEYHDLYNNVYKEVIMKPEFDFDTVLAKRIIKALIIYGIRNKEPLTAEDITDLIMADLGLGLGLSMINEDINDILMHIYQEVKGKGMEMTEEEDRRYFEIKPGSTGISIEPEILAEKKYVNENDLMMEIPNLINANYRFFENLEAHTQPTEIGGEISWHNTQRKGICVFKQLKENGQLPEISPHRDEIDFGLLLEVPLFDNLSEHRQRCRELAGEYPQYIFWIPEKLDKEVLQRLKRFFAVKDLLQQYDNPENEEESSKKLQLETEKDKLQSKLVKDIEEVYTAGMIVNKEFSEKDLRKFSRSSDLLEYSLRKFLARIYTGHPRYKKEIKRRQTNKLIKDFVIPRESREYTSEIENVAEPLGIVDFKGESKYDLTLDNDIFTRMDRVIEDGEWHSVEELYRIFRGEPWGLLEYSFEVILAALIANGECRARMKNGDILNTEKFNRSLISGKWMSNIDALCRGQMVNRNVWDLTTDILDIFGVEYEDKKTVINQDKIWTRLVKKSLDLKEELEKAQRYLLDLGAELRQFEEFRDNLKLFKTFKEFLAEVEDIKGEEPAEGLKNYRQLLLDGFNKPSIFKEKYFTLKKLMSLADDRVDEIIKREFHYFQKIESENEEIEEIIDNFSGLGAIINKPVRVREFLQRLEKVKEKYQEQYIKAHNLYHKEFSRFRRKIKELPVYDILKQLERIDKINVSPSLKERVEQIKQNYCAACTKDLGKMDIESEPTCNCGYQREEDFVPLSMEKVKEIMGEGVKEYFSRLKAGNFMEQIELYLSKNPESPLQKIKDIEPYDLESIIELVDEDFVLEVNRAFKSSYPVRVSLEDIMEVIPDTISSSEVNEVGEKVKKYLREKIKGEIEGKEEIDYERVVLLLGEGE